MRLLPFIARESLALIKIYPRRVVFELPKIDVIPSNLKVVNMDGRIFVIGCLESKVSSALAKDQNAVIYIRHVEGPVARDSATCGDAANSRT